jgi:hypothetical protein
LVDREEEVGGHASELAAGVSGDNGAPLRFARGAAIRPRMPQKPQDRAKYKRRQTKRLAKWRAKQESAQAATPTANAKPAK